jgi:hypothetical protein
MVMHSSNTPGTSVIQLHCAAQNMHNSPSFKQVSERKPIHIMIHDFNKCFMLLGNAIPANP